MSRFAKGAQKLLVVCRCANAWPRPYDARALWHRAEN